MFAKMVLPVMLNVDSDKDQKILSHLTQALTKRGHTLSYQI